MPTPELVHSPPSFGPKSSGTSTTEDFMIKLSELNLREQKCVEREAQLKAREAELLDKELRLQVKDRELEKQRREIQGRFLKNPSYDYQTMQTLLEFSACCEAELLFSYYNDLIRIC